MSKVALVLGLWLLPAAQAFAEHHSLIVLSRDDRALYEVDPTSGQVLRQVRLAGVPREAIFSWDEKSLFVTVPDAEQVAVIDIQKFAQVGQLTNPAFKRPNAGSPGAPSGLASSADGHKLYIGIPSGLLVYDQRLLVLNPEWRQTAITIAVPSKDGQHFKVQGSTDKLYYPHRQENQVVVIDTKTDTMLKSIPVPGGPIDVTFVPGNEVWVQAEDGTIAVIDSSKDVVKQTITTGGKGRGRIAIAPDIRFVASTHAESGDTAILDPIKKQVVATVKTGVGLGVPAFAPAGTGSTNWEMKFPTSFLYVATEDSKVVLVDVNKMAIVKQHSVGQALIDCFIRYTYPAGFTPPREATAKRVMETELFTVRLNAMSLYDVSPIHEHREDMVGFFISSGVYKAGCWLLECAPDATGVSVKNPNPGGLGYSNAWAEAGLMTGVPRGTLHMEEGGSPSPRRMLTFEVKNNYYRQTQTPKTSVMANTAFRKTGESPRAIVWDATLRPGDKPLMVPSGDFVVVYFGGALLRIVRDGKPEIVNRYYNEFDWDASPYSVEPLSNPVRISVLEIK